VFVPVSATEFESWLDRAEISSSPTFLSSLTGINRGTLNNQIRRGNVAETTVVAVARATGRDVMEALAEFTPYSDVNSRPRPPKPEELLSQVHVADLMAELQFRTSQKHYPREVRKDIPLIDFPHDGSHRAWVDAIDSGDIRHLMAEEAGMAVNYVFTQLSENRFTPPLAIAAARVTGGSFASGLVIIGLISQHEGQWPVRAREDALLEISDDDLVDIIAGRINLLQRRLKKRKEAQYYAQQLLENLG
jgi:hypothetical protein